jgi:hypothetical protein
MTDDEVTFENDGEDLFIAVNGLKVAKRARHGTEHAGMWIALEPGWSVSSNEDHSKIVVEYRGESVH